MEKFANSLSASEKRRAQGFRFPLHRDRFIGGRGILRAILARYLQLDAGELDFVYTEHGKPVLAAQFSHAGIHFNLAHTEDMVLLAVTRIGPVGVDVEYVRPMHDAEQLVARFFSTSESQLFRKIPSNEQSIAFFNLWTRKEAILKATGEGITQSLHLAEVSFLPNAPARLLAISGDEEAAKKWSLHEFVPAPGFIGVAAIQVNTVRVQCWKWC